MRPPPLVPPLPLYFLQDLSRGQILHQTECGLCGTKSVNYETFESMFVSALQNSDLQTCMNSSFTGEIISDYHCQNCHQKVKALRVPIVAESPELLTVVIKRWTEVGNKNQDTVKINKQISLPRVTKSVQDEDICYTFLSSVQHVGTSISSGHYTAVCRKPSSGRLVDYDDANVRWREGPPMEGIYILQYSKTPKAPRTSHPTTSPPKTSPPTSTPRTTSTPKPGQVFTYR
ncbi:MAG: hypothetical protein FJ333_06015 [Sphingomonadales bacterium]|nr:hypothetical protein [Sphingomonadales bacterium]